MRIFIIGFFSACWSTAAWASDAPSGDTTEETDRMPVAGTLLVDGFVDHAAAVMSEVDPGAAEIDLIAYWRLFGLVELRRDRTDTASLCFLKAIRQATVNRAPSCCR